MTDDQSEEIIFPSKSLNNESSEIIPFRSKFAFALGNVGNLLMYGIVYSSITFYYNYKLQADEFLLGWAWMIFLIWNSINDPLFGWISDNTRSKLGRRIPYLRYGSIFYGLLYILCWFPIASPGDEWGLFWNFLIVLLLFDTIYSLVGTSFYCLPNEMSVLSEERAKIGLFVSIFGIFSTTIQFMVPIILLTGFGTEIHPLFHEIMIIIGVLSAFFIFIASYFVKENKFTQIQKKEGFLIGMKQVIKNRPFLIYEMSNFSLTLLTTTLGTGFLYMIEFVLVADIPGMLSDINYRNDLRYGVILLLGGVITGGIIGVRRIRKWGPKKMIIISYASIALGFIGFFISSVFSIGGEFYWCWPFWILLGFGTAGAIISLPAITGEVIDYDELLTNVRREGVYAGFNAIVTKPAISLANWLYLVMLSLFGFVRDSATQNFQAQVGILVGFTLVPAFFILISLIALKFYPLTGEKWELKRRELLQIHVRKEESYQKYLSDQKKLS